MGTLTRKEFDVLNAMLTAKERLSQRRLEELTGYSLSTVNRTLKDLSDKELKDLKDYMEYPVFLSLFHGDPCTSAQLVHIVV